MKTNIGMADRLIRLALGVLCALLLFLGVFAGAKLVVLAGLGAIFFYTCITGRCPFYATFDIDTRNSAGIR